MYPEPGLEKNIVFGLFGSMAATGFVFGSLLGALLGQLAWWPIAFWIFGAICFAVAIMSFFAIPDMGSVRKNKGAKGECDVIGSFLALAGLILFNFAWNQSGIVGWVTPYEYILLIVGVALLVAFVVYEQHAPFPLVPVTYFTVEATFTLVVISAGVFPPYFLHYAKMLILKVRELRYMELLYIPVLGGLQAAISPWRYRTAYTDNSLRRCSGCSFWISPAQIRFEFRPILCDALLLGCCDPHCNCPRW